ncbi:MAG: hypothetical protein GQ468_02825 [Candidatus Scalindua sp.]|nr:hypothetical protein [Candidatus Scalindua sp.]
MRQAGRGIAWLGMVGSGMARQAGLVTVRSVPVRFGMAGAVGAARSGIDRWGKARQAGFGAVWCGSAGRGQAGKAGIGMARYGGVRHGPVWQAKGFGGCEFLLIQQLNGFSWFPIL